MDSQMRINSSLEVFIQQLDCSVVFHTSDSLHSSHYRFWGCSRDGHPGQGKGTEMCGSLITWKRRNRRCLTLKWAKFLTIRWAEIFRPLRGSLFSTWSLQKTNSTPSGIHQFLTRMIPFWLFWSRQIVVEVGELEYLAQPVIILRDGFHGASGPVTQSCDFCTKTRE